MKARLASFLQCPTCRGELALEPFAERSQTLAADARHELETRRVEPASAERTISEGVFLCRTCGCWYPIIAAVPVLLDFPTPLHTDFAERHRGRLDDLRAGTAPRGTPRPGERLTQASFSTEWLTVRDDELTFTYTHPEREDFVRIELDGLAQGAPGGPVLDVGCGYGTEARVLAAVTGEEVIGTDLNLSLLDSGSAIDRLPLVHTLVASLFALPFAEESFALVYSHGVLHHTYSTFDAFDAIAPFASRGGAIVIWVYARADFARGWRLRASGAAERLLRPSIARAPGPVQSAVVHALSIPHYLRYRRRGPNRERWRYKNSVHSIRDRWTPRYAHRHDPQEVEAWFRARGLEITEVDAAAYERRFGIPLIGIGRRGVRR